MSKVRQEVPETVVLVMQKKLYEFKDAIPQYQQDVAARKVDLKAAQNRLELGLTELRETCEFLTAECEEDYICHLEEATEQQ